MTFPNGRFLQVGAGTVTFRARIATLALLGFASLGSSSLAQDKSAAPPPSENVLSGNTKAWVSIPDAATLRAALEATSFAEMTNDPEVKPFVDDLIAQFRDWLNDQNIRFGMTVEDIENVAAGEVCLAGVLRPGPEGSDDVPPDHAVILMVDVQGSEAKARELLDKISAELTAREATSEPLKIGEIEATKWAFKQPPGLRVKQLAFHGLVGRWLVACDNELVFRDTVTRIADPAAADPGILADLETFQAVSRKSRFDDEQFPAHVRWFVEPFGYVHLAQAIADANGTGNGKRNDYAEILQSEGFSAVKGAGGMASFATGRHEAVHRTYIHAPHSAEHPLERGAAMLDFSNPDGSELTPPGWVPDDAASYLTFTWDLEKALASVGYIADSIAGQPGSWERTIDAINDDPNGPRVDLRAVVALLEDRVTLASVTHLPIDENSERILFGIGIRENEEFVAESVYRMVIRDADVFDHEGTAVLVVDTAEETELVLPDIETDLVDEEFGNEFGVPVGGDDESDETDEFEKPKPLFAKRVFAVKNNVLLIGNNVDQVKSVLSRMESEPGKLLLAAADYQAVQQALARLTGDEPPSFRHFGRMDRAIQANYEMMRTGRMGQSKTLLAQLLNRALKSPDDPEDAVRDQQIDGSQMPEDFEGKVAPYFGPTGLVVQTVPDGWLITGCVLKKQAPVSGQPDPPATARAGEDDREKRER